MTVESIIKYGSKFTQLTAATNFRNRAFNTTNTCLCIVMIDFPYYIAVSHRKASILGKAGYELI